MTGTGWGRVPRVGAVAAVSAALLLLSAACTFERRPDPRAPRDPEVPSAARDSVAAVVAALDDARRRGDLASALLLFDTAARVTAPPQGGAIPPRFLPARDALAAEGGAPGSPAPEPLALVESTVELVGTSTALALNRYGPSVGTGEAFALETLVLVRSGGGWRIRHLHRTPAGPP